MKILEKNFIKKYLKYWNIYRVKSHSVVFRIMSYLILHCNLPRSKRAETWKKLELFFFQNFIPAKPVVRFLICTNCWKGIELSYKLTFCNFKKIAEKILKIFSEKKIWKKFWIFFFQNFQIHCLNGQPITFPIIPYLFKSAVKWKRCATKNMIFF